MLVNLISKNSDTNVGTIDVEAIGNLFRFFDFERADYYLCRYHNAQYDMNFYAITFEGKVIFESLDKLAAIVKFITLAIWKTV